MLVLTRKSGEKLIINDNIEVVILETRGDSVKVGIKAPKEVTIYREEIYREIKNSNVESGKDVSADDVNMALDLLSTSAPKVNYSDKLNSLFNNKD